MNIRFKRLKNGLFLGRNSNNCVPNALSPCFAKAMRSIKTYRDPFDSFDSEQTCCKLENIVERTCAVCQETVLLLSMSRVRDPNNLRAWLFPHQLVSRSAKLTRKISSSFTLEKFGRELKEGEWICQKGQGNFLSYQKCKWIKSLRDFHSSPGGRKCEFMKIIKIGRMKASLNQI